METLLVYPNPWAAFDKDGHPCAVCPRDPDADGGGPGHFVGARLDKVRTQVLQDFAAMNGGGALGAELAQHELRSPMQSTKYSYLGIASDDPELAAKMLAKEPVVLPRTKFYRDRLLEGALIPADEKTAASARLRRYQPPQERLRLYLQPKPEPASPAAEGVENGDALPETPGMLALPESDADGNVLAPALPDRETREGVDAPADGTTTELFVEPAPEVALAQSFKSKRQESSS